MALKLICLIFQKMFCKNNELKDNLYIKNKLKLLTIQFLQFFFINRTYSLFLISYFQSIYIIENFQTILGKHIIHS